MFGKKRNITKAAHLKANTAGTSNELSFDVLEAAKNRADEKDKNTANVVDIKAYSSNAGGVVSFLFSKAPFSSKKGGSTDTTTLPTQIEARSSDIPTGTLKMAPSATDAALPEPTNGLAAKASAKARKKEARAQAKADKKQAKQEKRALKTSLDRVSTTQPYSKETAQVEVDRRKKIRAHRRIRVRVVAFIVALAVLGVGCYFGYQEYQLYNNQGVLLEGAVTEISNADEGIVQLDELLVDPLKNVKSDEWTQLKDDYSTIEGHLTSAKTTASELLGVLREGDQRTAADQIKAASEARELMLSAGNDIFDAAAATNTTIDSATNTWNDVLSADTVARDGVALLSSGSIDDSMSFAIEKLSEARSVFVAALNDLVALENSYENLDLSAYETYLEKRIESIDCASATAQALIDRNKEEASNQAAAFSASDEEATKLAAALPNSIAEPVETAFMANITDLQKQYDDARYAATAADDRIRDYLGV